ncbi:MAG: hypothetical protein IAF08_04285 [Rhizobacter sp.]|nr:hypothetical protein [Chlorobiales bacterium]
MMPLVVMLCLFFAACSSREAGVSSQEAELSGQVFQKTPKPFERWVVAATDGHTYDIYADESQLAFIKQNEKKTLLLKGRIVISEKQSIIRVRTCEVLN